MKNYFLTLLGCFFLISIINAQTTSGASTTYNNPIITGFNPDPSICKAGQNYYLVTSSFEYFPGVPIYQSTDLVNWRMIGHVLNRPSQLKLDGVKCSAGIFAPCIRFNKGTFYMVTTVVGVGNFVCTATNPAGPWSEPHWIANAQGIDPDLFFDTDGKVYMSATNPLTVKIWPGQNACWIQELDIVNWKLLGTQRVYIDSKNLIGTNYEAGIRAHLNSLEAPHIYKRNGYYYSAFSIGGTGHNHAFAITRSRNIYGPYELNPAGVLLTHRDLSRVHPITTVGHGDLVQVKDNQWAVVYLGKRPEFIENYKYGTVKFILGRETFISPVDWSGAWPIVNPNGPVGRSELVQEKFNLPTQTIEKYYWIENFNATKLHPQWTFIRTPRTTWWSLTDKVGCLNIQLRPEVINDQVNPSYICKRQEHVDFEVTTKMEFIPSTEKEEAGLLLERDNNNYIKYTVTKENNNRILKVTFRCTSQNTDSFIAKTVIQSANTYLKMSSKGLVYDFSYSANGVDWKILKSNANFSNTPFVFSGEFTGPMIGMYASSNKTPSTNIASFYYFYYKENIQAKSLVDVTETMSFL